MIFKSTSQTLISKEPWYLKRWFGGYLLDSCMRVGMREREERCAVIFIRSCCAIMISAHHYSHPVSDVPATSMPQKALCLLWTRRGERQRNIEFEKYRMKASVRVSQMIRNACVCVCSKDIATLKGRAGWSSLLQRTVWRFGLGKVKVRMWFRLA